MKTIYTVEKYFDTYPDGVCLTTEDEELAKETCRKKNKEVSHLPKTKYIIRTKKV